MDINKIVKDGFNLNPKGNFEIDLALISLRIALRAYFSTYRIFRHHLHIFESSANNTQEEIDSTRSIPYSEACAECIVHFQHFAELVCKNFLRNDHPLLSDIALSKPEILHKLLHAKPLTPKENGSVRSIEFSVALTRITTLIEKEDLKDWSSLTFIKENKDTLDKLNELRNRVWHRGIFILRYTALDKFMGGYILPFVSAVVAHPVYSNYKHLWRYDDLSCRIDPIETIISEMKTSNYDIGKIAFLKELGRAAYESPIRNFGPEKKISKPLEKFLNQEHINRSMQIASMEAGQDCLKITECPVCSVKSLIIHEETDSSDSYEPDQAEWRVRYTSKVKCECCSFELIRGASDGGIKNASDYGFSTIEDYWIDY